MRQEYNRLDPVNLLKRVSHCQETFWQYAWSKQSSQVKLAVTDITSAPCPEAGDSNKDEGTTLNSIVSLSRQYRRTNKPRKEMGPRTWRTRQDSFAPVWDKLRLQLELNPRITAKVLLDQLIIEQPEKFNHTLLRTLQRRVTVWRAQQNNAADQQHMTQISQEDITHDYLSLVMASATSTVTDMVQTKEPSTKEVEQRS